MSPRRSSPRDASRRPALLAVNQSVSQLFMNSIATFAARGVEVSMVAGRIETEDAPAHPYRWIRACRLRKSPAWRRIWTWGLFTLQAFAAFARRRNQAALITTNPPLVPWVAPLARRLFGLRYGLVVLDLYPDVMERMGMIRPGGLAARILRRLSAASLRGADSVVTLGDCMKRTLQRHLRPDDPVEIHVIPCSANTATMRPVPRSANRFALRHGLADTFVVMYSGSFGATHDLGTVVEAAAALRGHPGVRVVMIGGGTCERELRAQADARALSNLVLLPWQPAADLHETLAAADCHIVTLAARYAGVSIPSKTYTALAVGAALLAMVPRDSSVADLVGTHRCGVVIEPGDAAGLAAAIESLHRDPGRLAAMKARARGAAERFYDSEACALRQYEVMRDTVERSRGAAPAASVGPVTP